MATEFATYLADLDDTKPANTELVAEGDNHLRLLKNVLQTTFPGRGVTDMAPITQAIDFVPGVEEVGALYVINGATTCTMPVAAGLALGTHYWIWAAAAALTIDTSDGTLVNGAASGTIEAGYGGVITFDGTDWILVAVGPGPAGSGGGLDFGPTLNSWGGENTSNPTGTSNTAVGSNVLTLNSGDHNSGFGSEALKDLTTGLGNTALGSHACELLTTADKNTAVGAYALQTAADIWNTACGHSAMISATGYANVAVGVDSLKVATGNLNVVLGYAACSMLDSGDNNVAVGFGVMSSVLDASSNVAVGYSSMGGIVTSGGSNNIAIGYQPLYSAVDPRNQIAIGTSVMPNVVSVIGTTPSVAIGYKAAEILTTGDGNVCIGYQAGYQLLTGDDNVFIGTYSGNPNGGTGAGSQNTAIGFSASAGSGGYNCAFGAGALNAITTGDYNTALGVDCLRNQVARTNCAGLGYDAAVTGSNQVQLGNAATTTFAYGAVQARSDARDKTDVRSTSLGLPFILALRPVEFRWDYREDYGWGEKDGSKTRSRFHQGFIAQDVKQVLEEQRVDFGGFQDHAIAGGQDVMSLGYTEFIAPLVKAIQELAAEFAEYKRTHP